MSWVFITCINKSKHVQQILEMTQTTPTHRETNTLQKAVRLNKKQHLRVEITHSTIQRNTSKDGCILYNGEKEKKGKGGEGGGECKGQNLNGQLESGHMTHITTHTSYSLKNDNFEYKKYPHYLKLVKLELIVPSSNTSCPEAILCFPNKYRQKKYNLSKCIQ